MDQLEDPPKEELNVSVGKLLLLSIDSDNNDATGDTPLLPGHDHVKGFEWSVGVTVCSVEKEDTKVTNYCNPGGYNTIAAIPRVDFVRHNSNIFEDDQIFGGEVKGSVVKVQIPYVKIGVSAGKTIRIYAIENALPTINTFDKRFEPVELKLE
jgi:hypothetical protein